MEKKFILTNSKETADILIKAGVQCIQQQENSWLFLNERHKLLFYKLEKVVYTDKLFT